MALTQIKLGGLAAESVDSDAYVDASIDNAHLASGAAASAIDDLSDAVTTATSNVGLGSTALDSLSASNGNYNVAVGINAGTAITTGDNNTLIGYAAGDALVGMTDNTAIGLSLIHI